jgi:hypothetical protein
VGNDRADCGLGLGERRDEASNIALEILSPRVVERAGDRGLTDGHGAYRKPTAVILPGRS